MHHRGIALSVWPCRPPVTHSAHLAGTHADRAAAAADTAAAAGAITVGAIAALAAASDAVTGEDDEAIFWAETKLEDF